jgi:hypothetical protein
MAMDATTREIEQQQNAILDQMRTLRVMRRGMLSHQEYLQRRARNQGTGASGPYFVWQGFRNGKHFSKRVSARQVEQVEHEIETRRQFERLCEEYARLGEALAMREGIRTKQDESLKKGLKSRSKQAKK